MPEGVELKLSSESLKKFLMNAAIVGIEILGGRYSVSSPPVGFSEFANDIDGGLLIKDIGVKGKFMWWELENDWFVWSTYGMSGQWFVDTTAHSQKHTSIRISLAWPNMADVIRSVSFVDPRHFGTVKFVKSREALEAKLSTIGPDMLSNPPTHEEFRKLFRCKGRAKKTLPEIMMDQFVVSGIGNYIKAEALYQAEISPHKKIETLSNEQLDSLRDAIVDVMKRSYTAGGMSSHTYKDPNGKKGLFVNQLCVYGKDVDPNGNKVEKCETLDGRTTHWVPVKQR